MKNASTAPNRYVRKSETLCLALIACLIATILSGFSCAANAIPISEYNALMDLYNSTNGPNWTTKNNWGSNPRLRLECSTKAPWFGVTCDATSSHVTGINLHSNLLIGHLPDLSAFTELQIFDVDDNQLTGTIPSLSALTKLWYFAADYNELTGAIPSLSGLTNLTSFDVSFNQLTGGIPSLSGLTNLIHFHADTNQLTGTIPTLSGLTNLYSFYVYSNQLSGAIPDLAGLSALHYFLVGANHLSGGLPGAPSGLVAGGSSLCANDFPASSYIVSSAWDAATGHTPWSTPCNEIFKNGFE